DVRALMHTAIEHGHEPLIVKAVEEVNHAQKEVLFQKIQKHFGGELSGKHFAIWGLAFKPQTDDMREAPSVVLINSLLEAGATITAFDPEATEEAKKNHLGDRIRYAESSFEALRDADALVLVTEWNEFRHIDIEEVRDTLKQPVIFDGRNIFPPQRMRDAGFAYYGIGIR
ncbi:MAG: UDP binding domain-containing protein, partial [Planctomycetota bacterium]|nr:UDP binding domain-containing protein [Planctomycetota bacterium]